MNSKDGALNMSGPIGKAQSSQGTHLFHCACSQEGLAGPWLHMVSRCQAGRLLTRDTAGGIDLML